MDELLQRALDAITAQQPKERSAVWMGGEQLKDILRGEPALSGLVLEDLSAKKDALAGCEKKIKAFADAHKTGSFACVTPAEAEKIIREYFGLTEAAKAQETHKAEESGLVDLDSFLLR